MNLTLHHFRKEFRYLWPRWLVFLFMLVVDYAIQMEWLWALDPHAKEPFFYFMPLVLWSIPVWMAAWWLMLSVPPEDGKGASLHVRPLPKVSYWMARLLVWVVLVIIPLMLQNALVLGSLGRPITEVYTGMLARGGVACAMILWLLPVATLFHSWEKYLVILLFVFSLERMAALFNEWIGHTFGLTLRHILISMYDTSLMELSAWIIGPVIPLLAWWHARRPISRPVRLALPLVLATALMFLARQPWLPSPHEKTHDQALVDSLPPDLPQLAQEDLSLGTESSTGELRLSGMPLLNNLPDGVVVSFRRTAGTVTQGSTVLPQLAKTRTTEWV